ncbi:GNAT family N-acetyltransferase [Bacillus sp. B-jedd]|uniref:GNAT family N-acetyltransferase n=1 Tax=Bacillus sp. B-jedd TaxID=1476857 RepID=UPI000515606C|nr:GNAT family N-acetyltransferase [Bacillus sp. B-jedd]CEG29202.1 GCN5-like N-acetyltransferase [Bacillus sp. B-jedd]
MVVRKAIPEDGAKLAELIKHVEATSGFMMFGAGERKMTSGQGEEMVGRFAADETSALFVAEKADELIGYLIAVGGGAPRKRHCAYLVAGIAEFHRGTGVGTKLFESLEDWAPKAGIHRLELTVMAHNKAAIALYEKMGFSIEGTKHHSLKIDGRYVDEYYMFKLI